MRSRGARSAAIAPQMTVSGDARRSASYAATESFISRRQMNAIAAGAPLFFDEFHARETFLVADLGHPRAETVAVHVPHLHLAADRAAHVEVAAEPDLLADGESLVRADEKTAAAHVLDLAGRRALAERERAAAAHGNARFRS